MKIFETRIPGVVIIEPKVFCDQRGYFFESYNKEAFDKAVGEIDFVQDNQSRSTRGVIRGLHFQRPPYAQAKLVRCVEGRVLDVALDIRKGSPTYGQHVAVPLSADNFRQLFIPRGFAHGFAVLSDVAVFQYKCDNFYSPQSEGGILLSDPSLGIDWQIDPGEALLSEKDLRNPTFSEFETPFEFDD